MIVASNLSKSFGRRRLWDELSFQAEAGHMLALVGPSGSGKSTLLNCLGLLERVDSGTITVGGQELTRLGPGGRRRFRRDSLGYLFQNYALIDNATVRYNLDVVIAPRSTRSRQIIQQEALDSVGLSGRAEERVFQLSGGEQQRVALARLLMKRPRVVLADEPTGALDHDNADMVIAVLRELSDQGSAVVIATHNERVAEACDDLLDLSQVAGPPPEIHDHVRVAHAEPVR